MNAQCFRTGIMSEGPLNITNATEGPLGTMNATEGPVNITTPITTPILCQGKLFLILTTFCSFLCFPTADGRNFTQVCISAILTILFALIHALWQLLKFRLLIFHYFSCDKWCCKVSKKDSLSRTFIEAIKNVNWKELLPRTLYETIRILLYIFSIAFAAIPNTSCPCISKDQWQIGAVALFLAWVNAVTFIKLVPRLGVYVLMFQNVIFSFLKMLILGLLLVVAFGFTFYMLFKEPSTMVGGLIPVVEKRKGKGPMLECLVLQWRSKVKKVISNTGLYRSGVYWNSIFYMT